MRSSGLEMRPTPCQASQLSRLHVFSPRPFALQRPVRLRVRAVSNTRAAVRSVPGLQTMPWTGSKEQEEVWPSHRALHHCCILQGTHAPHHPVLATLLVQSKLMMVSTPAKSHLIKIATAAFATQALQRLEQRMQSCHAGTPDIATQRWFLRDR